MATRRYSRALPVFGSLQFSIERRIYTSGPAFNYRKANRNCSRSKPRNLRSELKRTPPINGLSTEKRNVTAADPRWRWVWVPPASPLPSPISLLSASRSPLHPRAPEKDYCSVSKSIAALQKPSERRYKEPNEEKIIIRSYLFTESFDLILRQLFTLHQLVYPLV